MANGDDGPKSSWSSWLAPGDVRRAGTESPHQSLDSDAKRLSQEHQGQSSQLEQHGYGRSETSTETFNPLIAFKRFVDDQFAAITEFPSNINELKRHSRDLDAECEAQRQAPRRWTGSGYRYADSEAINRVFSYDELKEMKQLAGMLIREADWRNRDIPSKKIIELFEDHDFNPAHVIEANSPWPFYHSDSSETLIGSSRPSPTHWLSVKWFKHNPYSPVNLEADTMLSKYDTKWRNAFEDLLEASLDKPMTSRERLGDRPLGNTAISTWRGPGLDWMLSLQCRGILPPQLPSIYSQGDVPTDYSETPAKQKLYIRTMGRADVHDLVYEIAATTLPCRYAFDDYETMYSYMETDDAKEAKIDAEEVKLGSDEPICPRHTDKRSSEDDAYETSLAERYYRDQMSDQGEAAPSPNRCPDKLGRAIGQAARESDETLTELDLYHHAQLQRVKLFEDQNRMRLMEVRRDAGVNVGEAARQQAARVFADEENGLGEDSAAVAWYKGEPSGYPSASLAVAWTSILRDSISALEEQNDELMDDQMELRDRVVELKREQKALLERLEAHEQKQKTKPSMLGQEAHSADQSLPLPLPFADSNNRPQVLSTLTTTQTTRMPDGSVKTTVVLKRRFADGGEETQESTQTSFDESAATAVTGNPAGQELSSKQRKSWFWS